MIIRITHTAPAILEHFAFEDSAARMARSAAKYGIERFYNMWLPSDKDERNKDTGTEILKAQTMLLSANSGASYLDHAVTRHWKLIQARLEARVTFRVVLLDPHCAEKALRNKLNHGIETHDHKVNLENLLRLSEQYPTLHVRFVERGMHGTVFCTGDCAFFDPYHLAVSGNSIDNLSYCLRVRDTQSSEQGGYLKMLRDHFETLWDDGVPLKDWHAKAVAEKKGPR